MSLSKDSVQMAIYVITIEIIAKEKYNIHVQSFHERSKQCKSSAYRFLFKHEPALILMKIPVFSALQPHCCSKSCCLDSCLHMVFNPERVQLDLRNSYQGYIVAVANDHFLLTLKSPLTLPQTSMQCFSPSVLLQT